MTPAARISATIEVVNLIEVALGSRGLAADRIVTDYFRGRRYAGSKDRRAVRERVYALLRCRGVLVWALGQVGLEVSPRALVLAHMLHAGEAFDGVFGAPGGHAPAALSSEEEKAVAALEALTLEHAPEHIRFEVPAWAVDGLAQRFGDSLEAATAALKATATLDIRLNGLKTSSLDEDLMPLFEPLEGVPGGYRRSESLRLEDHAAYRSGRIEIQDKAAQIASQLVGAQPGMQIVDLCAGGGGKTLAMAGQMANKGQIHAFDVAAQRLKQLKLRVQRAGARNVQSHTLPRGVKPGHKLFAEIRERADRVVLDVPCSGVGTWRRAPEQRWRLDTAGLEQYVTRQHEIIDLGAALVKRGGRLIYMTCSLLPAENEAVVDAFLERNQNFRRLNVAAEWAGVGLEGTPPESLALNAFDLCLAPHRHASDGFFIAILERIDA